MVQYTVDSMDKYIGQKIKDPYQRAIGSLVSIYSDIDGNVKAVEVLLGDVQFRTLPADRIIIQKDDVILLPEWKYNARKVIERMERAKARAKALDELYAKGEIPKHAYDEYKNNVARDLESLKKDANDAKDLIRKRINELEDQIVQIEKAITALKMSYIAGEIGERGYKPAVDILRQNRDRNLDEKNEAKKFLDIIVKLETSSLENEAVLKEILQEAPKSVASEQPIVVEVHDSPQSGSNNVGSAGAQ